MNFRFISAAAFCVWVSLCPREVHPARPLESFSYSYDPEKLYLKIQASEKGTLTVKYKAILLDGSPAAGKPETKQFDVECGDNTFLVDPMSENGHVFRLMLGASTLDVFANRGSWFVGPSGQNVTVSKPNVKGVDSGDVSLVDSGFGAVFGQTIEHTRVEVGRSFGMDEAYGFRVDKKYRAVRFEAEGSVGPVTVTLTERLDDNSLQYWDYSLMLGKTPGRYVIPFEKFIPRSTANKPLARIHSFAMRTLNPVKRGDRIALTQLALTEGGPFVASIKSTAKGVLKVLLSGKSLDGAVLHYRDSQGGESSIPVRGSTIILPDAAEELWVCRPSTISKGSPKTSTDESGATGPTSSCDPPDAPTTSYRVPPRDGTPLEVDRFDNEVPVNVFRLPFVTFGSSETVERRLDTAQGNHVFSIAYYPEGIEDYAGFSTNLPEKVLTPYKSISFSVRGSIPPNAVLAGIKDQAGREARIPFISYWPGDETAVNPLYDLSGMNEENIMDRDGFKTVSFPIAAFRAAFYNLFEGHAELRDISGVSLTMTFGGEDVFHELEVKHAAFYRDIVPISITAFDGDMYGINALGGVNFDESGNGGAIDVRLNADGYYGKGLKVTVSLPRAESYGLAAFGFGRLDVSDYNNISFYVRGEFGDEDAFVFLNDGKRRTKVSLKQYTKVTKMWRKVTIPLCDFKKKGIDLSHLSQLILAWEETIVSKAILYFDNFMFE